MREPLPPPEPGGIPTYYGPDGRKIQSFSKPLQKIFPSTTLKRAKAAFRKRATNPFTDRELQMLREEAAEENKANKSRQRREQRQKNKEKKEANERAEAERRVAQGLPPGQVPKGQTSLQDYITRKRVEHPGVVEESDPDQSPSESEALANELALVNTVGDVELAAYVHSQGYLNAETDTEEEVAEGSRPRRPTYTGVGMIHKRELDINGETRTEFRFTVGDDPIDHLPESSPFFETMKAQMTQDTRKSQNSEPREPPRDPSQGNAATQGGGRNDTGNEHARDLVRVSPADSSSVDDIVRTLRDTTRSEVERIFDVPDSQIERDIMGQLPSTTSQVSVPSTSQVAGVGAEDVIPDIVINEDDILSPSQLQKEIEENGSSFAPPALRREAPQLDKNTKATQEPGSASKDGSLTRANKDANKDPPEYTHPEESRPGGISALPPGFTMSRLEKDFASSSEIESQVGPDASVHEPSARTPPQHQPPERPLPESSQATSTTLLPSNSAARPSNGGKEPQRLSDLTPEEWQDLYDMAGITDWETDVTPEEWKEMREAYDPWSIELPLMGDHAF